ncbi:MAG TPA: FAD-dependent oxidoreductase [Sedimenticola sp.]|nr:FAD-dependent oxidoreductase [Sedimenticola sp.]
MNRIVIIGTGMAGYNLAREVRKLAPDVSLTLITGDDGRFYPKPMLSSALSMGKTPDQLATASAEEQARSLDARIMTRTRVTGIDSAGRMVTTDRGEVPYDRLVLAVGAEPIRPPIEGDAADAVLHINNLDDYSAFRRRLEGAQRVAIIGPGLIGCEFANDLLKSGRGVAVIGPDPHPVSTLLPAAAGQALQQALGEAGAAWHLGTTVKGVSREGEGYRLALANGETLSADLVLSAVGLRPSTALARAAGLEVNRGIVTDRLLQTSTPGIYALGDCAEVAGLNLPFVQPLLIGARALARTLTGEETPVSYPAMPVMIKTSLHPVTVAPPPREAEGEWQVEAQEDGGVKALFHAPDGTLLGFAFTGKAAAEARSLIAELPPLLP